MKHNNYTLIGMSNVGKSFWREKLAAQGFTPLWCDNLIETRLASYLQSQGYRGIQDVARWMGQPYEECYKVRATLYLEKEAEVMRETIDILQHGARNNFVIDTTGSVIYVGENILQALRELSTIVLLDAPESLQQKLYQAYLAEPKPGIWGEVFAPLPGEPRKNTLARCYPLLLRNRNAVYKRYADISLDYDELRAPTFTTEDFLNKVRRA